MSDNIKVTGSPTSYTADTYYLPGQPHRKNAVKLALELIHAHAASGCDEGTFSRHIEQLSDYADAIEAAAKKGS